MTMTDTFAGELEALKAQIPATEKAHAEAQAELEKLKGAWDAAGRSADDFMAAEHKEEADAIVAATKARGEAVDVLNRFYSMERSMSGAEIDATTGEQKEIVLSAGQKFTESDSYKAAADTDFSRQSIKQISASITATAEETVTFLASADGNALIQPLRIDRFDSAPERALTLMNLCRVTPTDSPLVEYVVEKGRYENPANLSVATPGANTAPNTVVPPTGFPTPESAFDFELKTAGSQRIGHHYKVPKTMLADVGRVQRYIQERGPQAIRNHMEAQIWAGDGTGFNFTGISNTAGTGTLAIGADTLQDGVHKLMTQIMIANENGMPTGVAMHPAVYESFVLQKDANGNYMNHGGATQASSPTIWGRPVVVSTLFPIDSVLVADFQHAEVFVRSGITTETGYINDQMISDLITMNFEARADLAVLRPAAFGTLTGVVV